MKKQSYFFLFVILILIVGLNSCTIEKRSYQPGYYVDWHNVNRKSNTNPEDKSVEQKETAFQEKTTEANNVDKIEDFDQPEAIQEYETVYASNDDNYENINIVNSKSTESFCKIKNNTFELKKDIQSPNNKVLSGNQKAKIGFTLSLSALITPIFTVLLYSFPALQISLLILSLCLAIGGLIFSNNAIKMLDKEGLVVGRRLAKAGRIISGTLIFIAIAYMIITGLTILMLLIMYAF
ncbi:MAG: hypothetical protein C0596_19015 [Marinilabiliales bacterium]|nr:MAG: hypothetical protein C0596_19015 [Marinilabiliales bacterium]